MARGFFFLYGSRRPIYTMITLSKSLTNNKTHVVYAIVAPAGGYPKRYRTSFTHPGEAEIEDSHTYKSHLWQHMQNQHGSLYKELARLARLEQAGKRIVIITHEGTQHGEVIVAAVKYLAGKLSPTPRAIAIKLPLNQNASLPSWQENVADYDLIDERRFVWVTSKSNQVTRLAYVWDTEGVVTALVPTFGLVKLGRLPTNFWYQRTLGHIGPRIHAAKVTLGRTTERTFAIMLKKQISLERIETEEDYRYQRWALREEEAIFEEEPSGEEVEAQVETTAFFNLYATLQPEAFAESEPSKFQGQHVKPVYKTKADGSRWVLTPQMQARGALHLYQPVK